MQINALEYLEVTAREFADKEAFQGENRSVTFGELLSISRRIGSALIPLAPKSSPIVIISEKSVTTIGLFLGALQAGCFYVPIDKDMPRIRVQAILDLVNAPVMLTDRESRAFADGLEFSGRILSEDEIARVPAGGEDTAGETALDGRRCGIIDTDAAYVIFTSGSTGIPKGVVGSHRSLIDYIDAFTDVTGVTSRDVLGNQSPLDYIAGIRDIYIPLKTGASALLIPKAYFMQPAKLFDYISDRGVTTIFWVASALSLCAELGAFSHRVPEALEKIVFTGSVLPCRHLREWQEQLPERFFMNQYGPTEITASCTYHIVDGLAEPDDVLPIGVPFRNTEILLLDEGGCAPPRGERGEICVRGTCLASGYYKNPEATEKAFTRNPLNDIFDERVYRTGDIGSVDERGRLIFHGRKDNQIKHMGHRVELGEIEAAATAMDGMDECVCLYNAKRQLITIFYTGAADEKSLATFLRGRLPAFMIPRKFVRLEDMPRLFNGKIDRNAIKAQMEES